MLKNLIKAGVDMQKIIFMDVDGTLVTDNGVIPYSAIQAIQTARRNGHLVLLCTGRSKSILFPEVLDIGFDGIVGAAGGYIELDGTVFSHDVIVKEDLHTLIDYFNEQKIDFFFESNAGLFASKSCKQRIRGIIDSLLVVQQESKEELQNWLQSFYDSLIEEDEIVREDINKVAFLGSDYPIEKISQQFSSTFTVIPSTVPFFGENSGEISLLGVHKATAIEKIIQHLDINKENTFAFEDGLNDIEMLSFVQYGIAMGNANEEVKRAAADITDRHDEDGIYNSFKKYGLI